MNIEKVAEELAVTSGLSQYVSPYNKCVGRFCSDLVEKLKAPTTEITVDMVEAKKVVFLKPIFEDTFVERGMKAWLTGVEWDQKIASYTLFFDFSDFEEENAKYFRATYYPNRKTEELEAATGRALFTAIEAGYYIAKHHDYFSVGGVRDDAKFTKEITEYLRVVE